MARKLTAQEVEKRLKPRGITMIDPFENTRQRATFRCDKGHEWQAVVSQVLHGYGCKVCAGLVPYTKERINEKIKDRGYELIGKFSGAGKPARFCCSEGHEWTTVPHYLLKGTGCPECAITRNKLSREQINEKLKLRGITVVGEFNRVIDYTDFVCDKGHHWEAKLSSVYYGESGCPECTGNLPITKEVVNERIATRDIELVGEYINTSTKTTFRCSKGHEWEAMPSKVMMGRGCPHCSGNVPLTKELINERLTRDGRGIMALTEHKANEKVRFRCPEGHEWETLAYSVLRGIGCPVCSGSAPLTKEVVNERLADRGIELVGAFNTSQTKATFRCSEGHEWKADPSNVMYNGTGCPVCWDGGTDNDIIYIWKMVGKQYKGMPVYKIGITSARLGDRRIKQVAKEHEVGYEVVVMAETKVPAMDIEAALKKLGENPGYVGDGATEIRAMSDEDLHKALSLIEEFQAQMHTQTQLSLL